MTDYPPEAKSLLDDADSRIVQRAQWEAYEFSLTDDGVLVRNGSHENPSEHQYEVTVDHETGVPVDCSCEYREHHNKPGKHMVAVALRTPVIKAASAMSNHRRVAADGGERDGADENSDGCDCELCEGDGLGCFDSFVG